MVAIVWLLSHTIAVPYHQPMAQLELELELETEGPEAEVPESKHSAHSSLTLVLLAMDRLVMSWA